MSVKITVDHSGKSYSGVVMRVRSTMLGVEDHGIFTAMLAVEGGSTGVSIGGYGLDAWDEGEKRRVGTAFGMEQIKAILHTAGVHQWEDVKGREIIVLYEGESIWGSAPAGFCDLNAERVLIFKEHFEDWQARNLGVAS